MPDIPEKRRAVTALRTLQEARNRGYLRDWGVSVGPRGDYSLQYNVSCTPRRRRGDGVVPGYGARTDPPLHTASVDRLEPALIGMAERVRRLFPELES